MPKLETLAFEVLDCDEIAGRLNIEIAEDTAQITGDSRDIDALERSYQPSAVSFLLVASILARYLRYST